MDRARSMVENFLTDLDMSGVFVQRTDPVVRGTTFYTMLLKKKPL